MRAEVDLDIGRKTFASGLLPRLIAALRRSRPGALVALAGGRSFGSTRILTVTCIATTAVCVPRSPSRDGNLGSTCAVDRS